MDGTIIDCAGGDVDVSIVLETGHRPWPLPDGPWLMTQTWSDLLFAHWPLPPAALRDRIPAPFELDLFDGRAWIGVIPFMMTNVALRGLPAAAGPSSFPELNLRTYVTAGGRPGVFFFSLDAGQAVAVLTARAWLRLPYHRAAMSLEYFLTERYCPYNIGRSGRPYRLDIHHPRWPLQPAEAEFVANTMTEASGIALPRVAPLLHVAGRQSAVAWPPDRRLGDDQRPGARAAP